MSDVKNAYGSAGQAITITLASLGDGAIRQSTAVDNSTNLFMDALVMVKIKTAASGVDSNGVVRIYVYATVDGGSSYSGECTGTDSSLSTARNLSLLGVMTANAVSTTFYSPVYSVASVCNGTLPEKWGIVIENGTGAALDSTGGNHSVLYHGVYATVA